MAIKVNVATTPKRADLLFLNPFEILVKEELRGRSAPPTPEQIRNLAESLYTHGQLQPVEARRDAQSKPVLTMGFTRCAAARLIVEGFKGSDGEDIQDPEFRLQVKIVDANDQEAFVRNVVENAQRNQTSPVDDALNQEKLRSRYGLKDTEIAKLYGYKGSSQCSRLRKVLLLNEAERALLHSGALNLTAALELLSLSDPERAEIVSRLEKGEKVTGEDLKERVRDAILRDKEEDGEEEGESEETGGEVEGEGEEAPSVKPRSIKKIRQFFEEYRGMLDVPKEGKVFARKVLAFVEGSISEDAFLRALAKLFPANED